MAACLGALAVSVEATHRRRRRRGRRRMWTPTLSHPLPMAFPCGISCTTATSSSRTTTITPVKAAVDSSSSSSFADDDDVGDSELNDAIQKSWKVLALQKDLLQQIVERRNLISSVKDSIINVEAKASSSVGTGNDALSDFDVAMTSSNIDQQSNKTATSHYSQSGIIPIQETPDIISTGDPDEKEAPLQKSHVETSIADALSLSRETDSATTKNVPALHPNAAKTYGSQDEKLSELPKEDTVDVSSAQDVDANEGNANCPPLAGENVMNVILVAAECAPWSKTGGLGDVTGALPKALAKRGHRVMVVAPRYGNYFEPQEVGIHKRYKVDGQDMEVRYFHAYIDGVDFVFIDSPIFSHHQNNIYGGERQDILMRMILFCKSAVEVPWHVPCGGICYGDGNLVFIANDWHTALLPVYLKAYYRDNGLMKYTRSVLVIHNIAHQGRGPMNDFALTDLPEHYGDLFKLCDPIGGEHFNIFSAGLKTADRIVAVSHGYTWELKTAEGGWGLHEIINENDWKLQGIVNGIDTKDWNPEIDVHLKADGYINFSLDTLKAGKSQCKAALQKELGLPVRDNIPVIGFIGRLDHQKGIDLIAEAIPWMVSQDMQLVMLGTGRADLEEMLRKFESQYHDKVRGWVGFSVKMAHRITAGADILLMPSRFEPCGLNQLYAMNYATIPVVHAVGGLRDTVIPFDPFSETGFGWTFDRAEANKLINALGHCLNTYWNYKSSWDGLRKRGMMQDLSWDNAAEHYEAVLVKSKYQW